VATGEQAQHRRQWLAGAMLIMLVAGAAWWTAWRADGDLRGELLQQARLAAQAVDVERVGLLTGTVADLESPDHHRMKEQLAVVGASLPAGRLLRLIGRKADGTLFVLVDGAAAGAQAAPPAQVDAAPADLRAVFDGNDGAVAGPLSDRLWPRVSAWVPIRDKADLSGFGTPDDAQAMVRKAVDFYRQNGRERFIAECNNPQGQFRRGNLYAFAYDLDMTMRAHPVTPELVGHNLLDKQDRSGSQDFRKEIQDVALSRGSGWVDYPYQNPANGKIEPKTTYVERVDDLIIASGAYQSSGEVVAALAMDIDSRTWQWEVAIRSAVPVGLMLALLIATIAGLVLKRRVDAAPKPLLRRLLAPLAAIIVLLTFGTAALLWQQYQRQLAATLAGHVAEVAGEWQGLLEQQSAGLAMTGQLIAADATVQKALRAGDGERLLAAWQPVFATLKRENQLTHFYFLDRNRVCLLRVHRPALRGDVINRFTARAAERNRQDRHRYRTRTAGYLYAARRASGLRRWNARRLCRIGQGDRGSHGHAAVPLRQSAGRSHPQGAPDATGLGRRHALAQEKLHLAASVFTYAREGILITTADGTIIDVNDAFSRITGYGRDEVVGQNPRLLSSGRHDQAFYADMWRALIDTGHWHGEIWNRRKSGEVFVEMQTISSVRDALGKPREYVSLFSDITVLKENERRLERIANYDALTGLPNRVLLSDRLRQGMAQAQRQGHLLAVAFLDLDGFKAINDSHGHKAGDELLIGVATRMTATLRESDTLARIGGDEFVAVLFDLADAAASEPMLSRLLAAAADPVPAGNLLLQVSASLGVTFYPQAAEVNADQLMRQADQAMYQAKLAGKNRYHVFDAEQDRSVRGHHQSVERVQRALTEHQFILHYQPKVNLRTGVLLGAEALIRWQHPEKGLLPPAVFLPTIADHPLAIAVGEWMIDAALEQIGRWNALGLSIPVSVNVGARHLQQANFVERLRALLAKHPSVRPCELDLEVQETSALKGLPRVAQLIDACREIGVSFSLDDFGSGYSSLTYLKRLSVSQIKIDQSFVRNMFDDPGELAILDAVLGLATAFGRLVIANGMETVPHGEMLLRLGCEHAQGYGIAPPMPADELARWSLAWRPDPAWARLPAVLSRDDLLEQLQTLLQQRRQ
jgi:diguanylate cyclase (GGDEF)-like protein/PAS domain S-box-containing protein